MEPREVWWGRGDLNPGPPATPGSAPLRAPKEPIFQEISLNWVAVASVLC